MYSVPVCVDVLGRRCRLTVFVSRVPVRDCCCAGRKRCMLNTLRLTPRLLKLESTRWCFQLVVESTVPFKAVGFKSTQPARSYDAVLAAGAVCLVLFLEDINPVVRVLS